MPLLLPLTFPEKSATIPRAFHPLLEDVEEYLVLHPGQRLLVVGHSEWGEPKRLAGVRAQATIDYLVSKGLARERFEIEARPAKEAERTPSEREDHRRIMFRILLEEGSSEP
jgi:outer membrane protein OmpA-like peptidoglycan-associated protein